jgi:hypothetical protein
MNTGAASRDSSVVLDEAASRQAMDAIRGAAVEGLLALPRVGVGIGGLLVGVRSEGRIQILDRIEIPCSHAQGPGFVLTAEEVAEAKKLAAVADPLEVLGIYLSKTRGVVELTEHDREVFEAVCPGTGRIALVVRPSTVEPTWAAILVRAAHGGMETAGRTKFGAEPYGIDLSRTAGQEIAPPNAAVQALKMAAAAAPPEPMAEGKRADEASSSPVAPRSAFVPAGPAPVPAAPIAIPEKPAVGSPRIAPLPVSHRNAVLFREPAQKESSRRSFAYGIGAVALIGAAVVFLERDFWMPPPELSLAVVEENGQLVFRWGRDAVAGADRGRLMVNDAGQLLEFPLDASRVRAGSFRYSRKSDQIVAKLVVGDRSARAVFFANSPAKKQ